MTEVPIRNAEHGEQLLAALSEQLAARGESHTIVVIGGSALVVLGFVHRSTRDVDVVALLKDRELISAEPLPDGLLAAAKLVAHDFGLPERWLNSGPTTLLDFGLPPGFMDRGQGRSYGPALEVIFASRVDQIHFKLYAVADQGGGRHLEDLQALRPTEGELLAAAEWTETHDSSAGHRDVLDKVLAYFGVSREPADR
jgi:Nucleotidyltransferase of unknown function (DUF6036)